MDIASMIPASERKEILELNLIPKAIGVSYNPEMYHLLIIWKTYIEPGVSFDCGLCVGRVLTNYRQLHKTLMELEIQSNLLKMA